MKGKTSQINLFLGLVIIMLGIVGSIFWGMGVIFQNTFSLWIGRLVVASLPFIVVLIERFIK